MNKKLKTYFEGLGFSIQGNNAYGNLKGYEVSANVAMLDTVAPVRLHVNLYANIEVKAQMINDIKALNFKYFVVDADIYGIVLGFNVPLTVGKLLNRMPEMLDKIFEVFAKYEAKGIGYCPICGEKLKEESKQYKIEWCLITMDNDCVMNVNNVIEKENKNFNDKPNNYLKGALGAAIGALVGVVAFVVLFFIGFISSLTSFIAILLGAYLYKKFEGKQNYMMIVIVSVISIVSMLLTVFGIYLLAAQSLAPEFGFSSVGIKAFTDMMTIKDFSSEFTGNLGMTFFYTIIGVAYEIYALSKSIKRQGKIN